MCAFNPFYFIPLIITAISCILWFPKLHQIFVSRVIEEHRFQKLLKYRGFIPGKSYFLYQLVHSSILGPTKLHLLPHHILEKALFIDHWPSLSNTFHTHASLNLIEILSITKKIQTLYLEWSNIYRLCPPIHLQTWLRLPVYSPLFLLGTTILKEDSEIHHHIDISHMKNNRMLLYK